MLGFTLHCIALTAVTAFTLTQDCGWLGKVNLQWQKLITTEDVSHEISIRFTYVIIVNERMSVPKLKAKIQTHESRAFAWDAIFYWSLIYQMKATVQCPAGNLSTGYCDLCFKQVLCGLA